MDELKLLRDYQMWFNRNFFLFKDEDDTVKMFLDSRNNVSEGERQPVGNNEQAKEESDYMSPEKREHYEMMKRCGFDCK